MNRILLFKIAILSLGFASCESDLQEDKYLFNYFFDNNGTKSIIIDSVSIIKYDRHPSTQDTVLVKFLVNYKLSEALFKENNILKPKINITAELYINAIEYPLVFEGSTKKINIYKGYGLFKNKVNKMYFKYILWDKDQDKIVCSDTLRFRVN